MSIDLEAIKARAERALALAGPDEGDFNVADGFWQNVPALAADVLALLAEREQMAARVAELEAENRTLWLSMPDHGEQ